MINRIVTLFLLSLLIIGCDSKENESPEIDEELDTTPPVLSISGLESSIEVVTTLNITIQDESNMVNTTVSINEQEVFSSNQKSFSFEVDPFDYPTGENSLTIISNDGEGNESIQSQNFEVRKLLVSIAAPLIASSQQVLISVNTMAGDLLAFTEVNRQVENVDLYADDDFSPQPIVVTSYILSPDTVVKAKLNSVTHIEPGTDLIAFQDAGGVPTENTYDGSPFSFPYTINVTEIETSKLGNSLLAIGNNHSAISNDAFEESGGFTVQLPFRAQTEMIENAVIYTSNLFAANIDDQIAVDDFKYLLVEEPTNSSISFSEFKTPSSIETIAIPSLATTYASRIFGFLDGEAYGNNEFRYLHDASYTENLNGLIDIPVIDEFDIVRNSAIMQLNDNRRLEVSTLGIKNIPDVPQWDAILSGESIIMSGEFDKFTILSVTSDNPDVRLDWSYTDKPQENFSLPFESFEFPAEFLAYATAQNLNLSSLHSNSLYIISLFDSSEELEFEELLFNTDSYKGLGDVFILSFNL